MLFLAFARQPPPASRVSDGLLGPPRHVPQRQGYGAHGRRRFLQPVVPLFGRLFQIQRRAGAGRYGQATGLEPAGDREPGATPYKPSGAPTSVGLDNVTNGLFAERERYTRPGRDVRGRRRLETGPAGGWLRVRRTRLAAREVHRRWRLHGRSHAGASGEQKRGGHAQEQWAFCWVGHLPTLVGMSR